MDRTFRAVCRRELFSAPDHYLNDCGSTAFAVVIFAENLELYKLEKRPVYSESFSYYQIQRSICRFKLIAFKFKLFQSAQNHIHYGRIFFCSRHDFIYRRQNRRLAGHFGKQNISAVAHTFRVDMLERSRIFHHCIYMHTGFVRKCAFADIRQSGCGYIGDFGDCPCSFRKRRHTFFRN